MAKRTTQPRLVVLAPDAETLAVWHAKAKDLGRPTSVLVRQFLDGLDVRPRRSDPELPRLRAELARARHHLAQVGNNLNQLMRAVHSHQVLGFDESKVGLLHALADSVELLKVAVDTTERHLDDSAEDPDR